MTNIRFAWINPSDQPQGNPANWRVHPTAQAAALEDLIYGPNDQAVGWVKPVIINERRVEDGWDELDAVPTYLDGHCRSEIASRHNAPIPAVIGSWSPDQERKILLTLDSTTDMADANTAMLATLLSTVTVNNSSPAVKTVLEQLAAKTAAYIRPASPSVSFNLIGATDEELSRIDHSRPMNNLSKLDAAHNPVRVNRAFSFGDIGVAVPIDIYERFFAYVMAPEHTSRLSAVIAILENGMEALE